MFRPLLSIIVALIVLLLAPSSFAEDQEKFVRDTLARFEVGDPGWKIRMESLVKLARVGPEAVPVLVDALHGGSPSVREFAAQTLAIFADPSTKPALMSALNDSEPGVRVNAIKALTMFGPLELTDAQQQRLEENSHWMLRHYIDIAIARDDRPDPEAIRRALVDYDLAQVDTAQVGHMAPDFSLKDDAGKTHRLNELSGQKLVVLEFHPGDG
jgi:HEAT repeats/AhpC/TSA family